MPYLLACIPDWMISGKDYWFALVSAAVGVIGGILLTEWRFSRSEALRRKRRIDSLLESIRLNVDLIDIALGYTDLKGLGNFPMDGMTLGARISACVDDLPAETIKSLNWERFQLDHIAFKVLVANITLSTAGHISTSPSPTLSDVSNHLRATKEKLTSLSEQIATATKK
jgi:hypothetical protein